MEHRKIVIFDRDAKKIYKNISISVEKTLTIC